jgi:hypothetical protein
MSRDTPCLTTERPCTSFMGQNMQTCRDELWGLSVEKKDTLNFSDSQ